MCQIVWIQIRPDILLVLIWVHSACKGYRQTIKVAGSRERVCEHEKKFITSRPYLSMKNG